MDTLFLKATQEDIQKAADILKNGGLVGMPTETVYGLGANALNPQAIRNIFKAKGRPCDNPLIIHISSVRQIDEFNLWKNFPKQAKVLAERFWPGPLTIIAEKGGAVPNEVSAGLDTVALRFPSHPVAQRLITAANLPVAAPSANLSGSPSPTTPQHVMRDLNGKIDAVIDGGVCQVGVESTVITLAEDIPRILRPGGITPEQLRSVLGRVDLDDAVLHKLGDNQQAASPGMKYKHYAPGASVIILKGGDPSFYSFLSNNRNDNTAVICYDEDLPYVAGKCYSLGGKSDLDSQAHKLFGILRKIDDDKTIKTVYSRCPDISGVGLAVYNRLIRAAGFEVKSLEEV